MRCLIARLLGSLSCLLIIQSLAQAQEARLDRDIPLLLSENHVPSVSIAQIRNGKIVLLCAYGQQDPTTPANKQTLYNIASLTKPITAQVAMRLISQGAFALDDQMYTVWTDPDVATDERRKLLTPRIALTHQTGFANWRSMTGDKLTFRFTPGTRFSYSGEGFEYLARFMEKKTGDSLDRMAQQLVFDPLAMHDTAFTYKPWFQGRVASPANAQGQWMLAHFSEHPVSADMVYTTARDYALLLQAVFQNRDVSSEVAHERDKIQIDLKSEMCPKLPAGLCPEGLGSGLSWQVLHLEDGTVLMHTGHDPGVYSFAFISPGKGFGAVILTNGENGRKIVPTILRDLNSPKQLTEMLEAVFK